VLLQEYVHIFNPVIGLVINVSLQILIMRLVLPNEVVRSFLISFVLGFLTVLSIELYVYFTKAIPAGDFLSVFITNTLTYVALGYCYSSFLGFGESSIRTRILRELHDSERGLSEKELAERYNTKNMFENRIKRLIDNRQLILQNGKFYIKSSFLATIAKAIVMLKLFLLGKRSEFD